MLPTPLTFVHGIPGSVAVNVSGRRRDASEIISIALLCRVPHHPVFPEPNEAKSLGGKFDPDNGLKNLLQDGGTLSLHSEDPDGFFFNSSSHHGMEAISRRDVNLDA